MNYFLTLNRLIEQRISFSSGDFIKIKGHDVSTVRLDLVLVHELPSGEKRAFLLVTDVLSLDQRDVVLDVPCLRLTRKWRIIGLPGLLFDRIWIVPRVGAGRGFQLKDDCCWVEGENAIESEAESVDNVESELLLCPWEITFM
jgi:hypothetical protein